MVFSKMPLAELNGASFTNAWTTLGFGDVSKNWIETLFANGNGSVVNNGYSCNAFKIPEVSGKDAQFLFTYFLVVLRFSRDPFLMTVLVRVLIFVTRRSKLHSTNIIPLYSWIVALSH